MNVKQSLGSFAIAVAMVSGSAIADRKFDQSPSFTDRAKVVEVEPLYRWVRVSKPEQRCWEEEVQYTDRGRGTTGGTVAGGVVGAVAGNRIAGRHDRAAGTVIGGVAGALIGHELTREPTRTTTRVEERCETIDRYSEERELDGYRVKYRYRGDEFWTETREHPGEFLRVRVDITPLER